MSLLDTGNEILIDTPVTTSLTHLASLRHPQVDMEDTIVQTFKTVLNELSLLTDCLRNEQTVGSLPDGDVTTFTATTFPRLIAKVYALIHHPSARHEIDQGLFEHNVVVTCDPKDKAIFRVYVTQQHYFQVVPPKRVLADESRSDVDALCAYIDRCTESLRSD